VSLDSFSGPLSDLMISDLELVDESIVVCNHVSGIILVLDFLVVVLVSVGDGVRVFDFWTPELVERKSSWLGVVFGWLSIHLSKTLVSLDSFSGPLSDLMISDLELVDESVVIGNHVSGIVFILDFFVVIGISVGNGVRVFYFWTPELVERKSSWLGVVLGGIKLKKFEVGFHVVVSPFFDIFNIDFELVNKTIVIDNHVSWVVLVFEFFIVKLVTVGELLGILDIMPPDLLSSFVELLI
jgi:hypothetical protein